VEPCVFAHFAVNNIRDKSLLDVLRSPFFAEYQKRQHFSDNLLHPCPIIDNPRPCVMSCRLPAPIPPTKGRRLCWRVKSAASSTSARQNGSGYPARFGMSVKKQEWLKNRNRLYNLLFHMGLA
jgi:hypothetical protein